MIDAKNEQAEFLFSNADLQAAIDSTFAACNSVLQEHTTGGKARSLCVAHLEKLLQAQLQRIEAMKLGDGK